MKKKENGEVFNKRYYYNVFIKNYSGGGRVVVMMQTEAEGVTDYIYHVSTDTEKKKVILYEISSPGVLNTYWANRATLGNMGYVGVISGYGANAYFKTGGALKEYIQDFGTLAKKPGFFKKLIKWLF